MKWALQNCTNVDQCTEKNNKDIYCQALNFFPTGKPWHKRKTQKKIINKS